MNKYLKKQNFRRRLALFSLCFILFSACRSNNEPESSNDLLSEPVSSYVRPSTLQQCVDYVRLSVPVQISQDNTIPKNLAQPKKLQNKADFLVGELNQINNAASVNALDPLIQLRKACSARCLMKLHPNLIEDAGCRRSGTCPSRTEVIRYLGKELDLEMTENPQKNSSFDLLVYSDLDETWYGVPEDIYGCRLATAKTSAFTVSFYHPQLNESYSISYFEDEGARVNHQSCSADGDCNANEESVSVKIKQQGYMHEGSKVLIDKYLMVTAFAGKKLLIKVDDCALKVDDADRDRKTTPKSFFPKDDSACFKLERIKQKIENAK